MPEPPFRRLVRSDDSNRSHAPCEPATLPSSPPITTPKFIDFCRRLLDDRAGPVFLILNGHPVHRSKAVAGVRRTQCRAPTRFRIPAYPLQLNLDE